MAYNICRAFSNIPESELNLWTDSEKRGDNKKIERK